MAIANCEGIAAQGNTDFTARVEHIEPPSWWTHMNTPLQVMFHGTGIGDCTVALTADAAKKGVAIDGIHRAESPNYLFVDIDIAPNAKAGTYLFRFTDPQGKSFDIPYEIAGRNAGSRERKSFTTADLIYLLMPDRRYGRKAESQ